MPLSLITYPTDYNKNHKINNLRMAQIANTQNENAQQRPKVQLQSLRMQTEILIGDNLFSQRAFQMPVMALDAKHPFLQAALENGPILSLSDCDDSANFYESEPEILLTDSDEEEIDEAEVETAAGSSDDQG